MPHSSRTFLPWSLAISVLTACGGGTPPPAPAKQEEKKEDKDGELEARMAERKAKREAEDKAKAEATKARDEALERITIVPAKKPKKFKEACDEVAAAQDRFMQRMFTGEVKDKWMQAKDTQLPMTIVQCNKTGSLEVAACQAHALDNAPPELKEDVTEILRRCADKFAPPPSAADAKIPTKRPG